MQNNLLQKGITFAIIGLFFGMNAASSTENKVDYAPAHKKILDSVDNLEFLQTNEHIAYAVIGSYSNCSVFEFKLDDLENLTCICEDIPDWGSIAWISPGVIIFSDYYGNIYKINLETCEYTFLGSSGTGEILSLAYDPSSNTLYGGSSSSLYEIDKDNGSASYIGAFGQLGYYMVSIDCDRYGNMYGIDFNYDSSRLYTINTSTGHSTPISCIFFPNWAQLAYDKDYDVLYECYKNYEFQYELYPIIGTGYNGTFQVDERIFDFTISFTRQTQPPYAPYITGTTSGIAEVDYAYNFSLYDVDNNLMFLRVDWGNGISGSWIGPYDSDSTVKLNHTWYKKGTFTIRAQAKDIYGAESNWSTLEVTMPKSHNLIWWIDILLNRFPLLSRLLGWLI